MRHDGRDNAELRSINIQTDYLINPPYISWKY
ncbi:MAG: hypothetical protein K0S34_1879 [Bacillales bacterium]|nr:hypothetical protein [Bacillales bacterium]